MDANTFPYQEERKCDYKGEHYSVRDNGAIMRHAREGKPLRKDDEEWSFGKKDEKTGYMIFCGVRVHIVVATAFYGEHDSKVYVVDHIDTNRCNNRPDNLRWLTRLENALNNPATLKKITYLCGGDIQKFLDNPSCLRDSTGTNQDVMWMRTVSAEEAKNAYINIMRWAEKPSEGTPSGGSKMGEWVYQQYEPHVPFNSGDQTRSIRSMLYDPWGNQIGPKPTREEKKLLKEYNVSEYFETSNKLAQQLGWRPYTNPEFPCCPDKVGENPLQEYAERLVDGAKFVTASYGSSIVYKYTVHNNQLLVISTLPDGVKKYGLTRIMWNGKVFVHESLGTYFEEKGVLAEYNLALK